MSTIEHAKAPPLAGKLAPRQRAGFRFAAGADRSFLAGLAGLLLLCAWLPAGWAQFAAPLKVYRIEIKPIGPPATSDELIRSNLRVKVGDPYLRAAVDDDVRTLYGTGFFYNIQVAADDTPNGVILTYKVQGKPRLTEHQIPGKYQVQNSQAAQEDLVEGRGATG